MKILILAATIFTLMLSCTKQPEKVFNFTPNGKTILKIQFLNCSEPKSYAFFYNQTFPSNQFTKRLNILNDTIITYVLDLTHPSVVNFFENDESARFFIIPNDTLTVSIDYKKSNNLKESIEFEGTTSNICDYLTRIRNSFYGAPAKNESPESFCNTLDAYYDIELKKLDSVNSSKALPEWYFKIERANLTYERDFFKLLQFQQHLWFNQDFIQRDDSLKNSIEIMQNDHPWLENYERLLAFYCPNKYDTLLDLKYVNQEIFLQYLQDNIDEVKGKIPDKSFSYFVAAKLSVLFNHKRLLKLSASDFNSNTKLIDGFIEKNSYLISDTILLNYLNKEKAKKYKEYTDLNRLSIGDEAPNFNLEDVNGKTVQLSDFRHKVVLLNFWGTYCDPCIKSIPKDNKIAEDFKQSDFVLVNICTDYNLTEWKKIIKDHDFKGVHLICKGNWNEILKAKYNILGVPHYAIVDKNGLIVKNSIRDSIDYYIKKGL